MEYHVVIVWNKALSFESIVKSEILKDFEIIGNCFYNWDEQKANKNFALFYGEKLDNIDYKVKHCGSKGFSLYLIKDKNEIYDYRDTTSGKRKVNIRIFDLKKKLRLLTGGGHKIHATDDQNEVKLNLASLFGKSLNEMIQTFEKNKFIKVNRNVMGCDGWKDWNSLFMTLNLCTNYLILRNLEELNDSMDNRNHGDVDILVEDRKIAETIIGGEKINRRKQRTLYKVLINNKNELIDIRYLGDNYYPLDWEKQMLLNRYKYDCYYLQEESSAKYSLLYHALVHKQKISKDYLIKLNYYFNSTDKIYLRKLLDKYMEENNFFYTMPCDYSVYINKYYFSRMQNITSLRKSFILFLDFIRKIKAKNGKN